MNKYLLLIKSYWEYAIVIVPLILLFCLEVILDIKIPNFYVLSFLGLTLVVCLIITNIRHKNETKKQLFDRYLKVGFIFPVMGFIIFLIKTFILGPYSDRSLFWIFIACFIIAVIIIPLSIAIGYFIRFIMTVRSTSSLK